MRKPLTVTGGGCLKPLRPQRRAAPAPRVRARAERGRAMTRRTWEIGVISDTHGLLRSEAIIALRGVDRIVHAGDVGSAEVLRGLEAIAPVLAVRGNNDHGPWAAKLPLTGVLEVGGAVLYVIHDVKALDLDPRVARLSAVIAGHSHRPLAEERDGVLFFNPGSAGPRRFSLPVSLGRLTITGSRVVGDLRTLDVPA